MAALATLETIAATRAWLGPSGIGTVGLVPTMGFLHAGHLALVTEAREICERVVASIFVNPAQFDREEDLAAYPVDLERDRNLLAEAGCDALFLPPPAIMYPAGFDTWVEPGTIAAEQEGRHRPGHFRGVATVVLKLLNIVQPSHAFFGQKDAQQLAVIRALARDLDVPTEIVPVATQREDDGLARSSRNVRLNKAERQAATVLYRGLAAAREAFRSGEGRAAAIAHAAHAVLETEPHAHTEYVSVADPDTLRELDTVDTRALVSLAVWIGKTRLIDNLILDASERARDGA